MKTITSEKRSTGDIIFRVVFNLLMAVILFVFLVSAAVFLVLALKPLYSWFIKLFGIEAYSGYDAASLRANYDALIDYNMFWGPKELVFPDHGMVTTEQTMAHFVDVKQVFVFFQYLAIGSAALLIPGCVVAKKKNISLWPKITLALAVAVIVGVGIGLIFFWDQFFIKFHEIVFPGKTNWYINSNYDKVILILPSEVFLADAAAILIVIALGIAFFVLFFRKQKDPEASARKKQERKEKREAQKAEREAQKAERAARKAEEEAREEREKEEALKAAGSAEGTAEETIEESREAAEEVREASGEEAAAAGAASAGESEALQKTPAETAEESCGAAQEIREAAEETAEEVKAAEETAEETLAAAQEKTASEAAVAGAKASEAVKPVEGSTTDRFEEMDEEIARTVEAFDEAFEEIKL